MTISGKNLRTLSLEELAALAASIYPQKQAAAEKGPAEPHDAPPWEMIPENEGANGLSLAQERLWFMDRLSPENPFYNIPFDLEITGSLNHRAFRQAWLAVIARHECLTSVFPATPDGTPELKHIDAEQCALRMADIRASDRAQRQKTLREAMKKEAATGFSLASGPLARGTLYQLEDTSHTLLYTFHHIIFDGWSLAVFLDELFAVYEGICTGNVPDLPKPPSYARFAQWQRAGMDGPHARQERDWWKKHLDDLPSLEVRPDFPRPDVQSFKGHTLSFSVPHKVSSAIDALAHRHGATPFMAWLAIYALILGRMSGQSSFAVGSSISGREHPLTERMVGFFLNNLVVRTDINSDANFISHLRNIRQSVLLSLEHAGLPFQFIADGLGQNLDISRNPVYQAALTYQNAPMPRNLPAGLELRSIFVPSNSTHLDMELLVEPGTKGHTLYLTYATDIFSLQTAKAACRALSVMAEKLASDPAPPLRVLLRDPEIFSFPFSGHESVISGPEKPHAFRDVWSRFMGCVHTRFESVALKIRPPRHADAPEQDITYARLAAMVDGAARLLSGQGLGPGKIVALMPASSLDLIVVMLAVWRTGAAWVPLDPDYPPARNRDILLSSGASILVAAPEHLEALCRSGLPDGAVRLLPAPLRLDYAAQLPPPPPACTTSAEDLACILHTSGSTGVPKGIELTHGAMAHRWEWMWRRLPWQDGDLAYLKTSPLFVDFLWEVFGALLAGTPLLITDRAPTRNVPAMVEEMERHGVTQIVLVPSLLSAMTRVPGGIAGRLPGLKTILSSGEPLAPELAVSVVRAIPGILIVNLYGSTEVMDATYFCISGDNAEDVAAMKDVPLGVPIDGTSVALMDDFSLPVAAGSTGVIHIAGPSLARGYRTPDHNRAFLRLDGEDGQRRWFRIGDLGRIDENGNLHYLGRRDQQIKIRGVRIEADAVRDAMQAYVGVQEAVVGIWSDRFGHQRLAGFITMENHVPEEQQDRYAQELRGFLLERLPTVMVPDNIRVVAQWPRTPSGKIDRQTLLKSLETENMERPSGMPTIGDSVKRTLERLWREAIGLQNICTEKNFFEAGGNSLLLVQLHESIQKEFHTEFPLTELFRHPTIESQAALLRGREVGGRPQACAPAQEQPPSGMRARRIAARAASFRREHY